MCLLVDIHAHPYWIYIPRSEIAESLGSWKFSVSKYHQIVFQNIYTYLNVFHTVNYGQRSFENAYT